MKNIAWIFARGGSKGLPGKNIRPLAGRPLISWSIKQASESGLFDKICVSTDSEDIATIAAEYGAEIPFLRPSELAGDNAAEFLAWKHAAAWQMAQYPECEGFVSVPTTSPLRSVDDLQNAVLVRDEGFDLVLAVTPSQHHPSFNMVYREDAGLVSLIMPPANAISRRQDARTAYNITTLVYATTVNHVLSGSSVLDGRIGSFEVPVERSPDIDTLIDFKWIEFLLESQHAHI